MGKTNGEGAWRKMNFHKRALIALLFQFVDINLGQFDILPDFIGYLIMVFAFSKLTIPYAKMGMYSAVLLSIQSFIELFQPKTQGIYLYEPVNLWLQVVMIVIGLLYIVYLACIFSISKEILQGETRNFPKLFIGMHILSLLLTSVGIHLNYDEVDDFVLIWLGIYLLFYIYFIGYLWRRKNREKSLEKKDRGEQQ